MHTISMAKQAAKLVKNKFFVANLHWSCSEGVLRTYFQQFGPVARAEIVFDMKTGMSKGFGFVRMINDVDFEKALSEKQHIIEGTQAFVKQYAIEDKKTRKKKKQQLGTPVDADSFTTNTSATSDVDSDHDVQGSDTDTTRTTAMGKESSV